MELEQGLAERLVVYSLVSLDSGKVKMGYDVCIVGSGAGGGMAAYVLTRAGAKVILLEAGGPWDSRTDSAMLTWPYDSPRRGAPSRERPFGEFDACIGGWEIAGEPYTVAPGNRFDWWRARMLGGRTNHWGRISLRFGPDDFRARSLDGLGDDWPIGYDDLQPYYDQLDRLVGIFGSVEGLRNHPDGIFLPPPRPRCYELLVKNACDRLGVTCIPARISVLTRQHNGRPACHYCGQCYRGCRTNSNFSSPGVLLSPALDTGRLILVTNAMVREVTVNRAGVATGVSYIDKTTGRDRHVQARVVVLAASSSEDESGLADKPVNRPGCCSTPSHPAFPTGWPTPAERWGSTSPTRPAPTWRGSSPDSWIRCPTMKRESEASTCTCPGGWTIGSWTFPEAITSRCGAVSASPPMES